MRRLLLPLALAFLPGCSGDPASSRLKIGDEAIVRVPDSDPKRPPIPTYNFGDGPKPVDFIEPDTISTRPNHDGSSYRIQSGTKVRIIADDGPAEIAASRDPEKPYLNDLDGMVDRRWVKAKVIDGRSKDVVAELPRNTLRPVR